MSKIEELQSYEIIEQKPLQDLNSYSYLLKHKKSGAKIAIISNDDDNKVFYIGFRTPPKDSTGVAHILEHSVLCGSKDFPVKDPFVELVKGSLNTFLNAMTYPDKTVYPVASCNDQDFKNLMHVYLDAVFYPNIYKNDKIFKQEGWHYELEDLDGELTVNGVVYNEMKGALSSPDDIMNRWTAGSLYPDTTYGQESGGDPEVIPSLTYDDFLEFHRTYYHPSNSYIYLYGNMDIAERLEFLDQAYLSKFDYLAVNSEIEDQKPFDEMVRLEKEYPISEEADEAESGYLSMNFAIGDNVDEKLYVAFKILDYALCSASGAPLEQALMSKGIGKEVYSYYYDSIKQSQFSVISTDTDITREEEFKQTIMDVLEEISKNGFNQKALLAAINYYEFKYREADFGSYPKGLMYGLQMLDSWLYDEKKPFVHIQALDTYAFMKEKVSEGYFEELLRKYLINNNHKSLVVLKPVKGLAAVKEEQQKQAMAELKKTFTKEQLQQIIEDAKELKEYQDSEDLPENLAKIPMLTRGDMKTEARRIVNEERKIGEIPTLVHPMFTNGIAYIQMSFDLSKVPEDIFPYIGLMKSCIGKMDTAGYEYGDLFNEINLSTGGIGASTSVYPNVKDADRYKVTMNIKSKVLYENIGKALDLMLEMMLSTAFEDEKRLKEIVAEGQSRMQSEMSSAGHSVALGRALAYGGKAACVSERMSGISFYRLIAEIQSDFEGKKQQVIDIMKQLAQTIFRKENLMVDFTGTEEGFKVLCDEIPAFVDRLYTCEVAEGKFDPVPVNKKEGFMTSGQVQYVCRAGNFVKKGLPYTGTLRFLKVMLGYEYLWVNVRVKGGAYGCMCNFNKNGDCYFVSYRDPNLSKTIEVFEKAAQAVAEFEADERVMTQYIIGAVSDLDIPMNPAGLGGFSLNAYMCECTQEMLDQERKELLNATEEDIKNLSKYIEAFMSDDQLCCVGNEMKVKECKDLFDKVENLY